MIINQEIPSTGAASSTSPTTPAVVEHQSLVTKPFEGAFTFCLTNLTGGDVQFLSDLVALFCDPKYRATLEALRAGRMGLYRDPQSHKCLASDLFTPPIILKRQTSKN